MLVLKGDQILTDEANILYDLFVFNVAKKKKPHMLTIFKTKVGKTFYFDFSNFYQGCTGQGSDFKSACSKMAIKTFTH